MRALITGITGFVGSHLAEFLLEHTDWAVAGTVYGRLDNVAHLRDRLDLYPAELSQIEVVRYLIEETQPDYVFHLAAQPIPALSKRDPWFTLENNIRAQLNVLQAVAETGARGRVLVVGSSEEYGQISPEDLPVDEATPLRPTNPYAVSKITQDYLGLQYAVASGVDTVRVRPFNHIGPRQRRGFVAPDFACQIAEIEAGLRPPEMVVGRLDVSRDFSDVRDIVRGYYLAMLRGETGEVYNLGAERDFTVQSILDALIGLTGRHIRVVQDANRLRSVEAERVVSDCSKFRALTGWRTEIPMEQSLRDVLDYWREQVRSGAVDPTPAELRLEERTPARAILAPDSHARA